MSNSRTSNVSYRPRYTQMEAYDLLPQEIRDALKEGPQEWDTGWVLRECRKRIKKGEPETVVARDLARKIRDWHAYEIAEGKKTWSKRLPGRSWKQVPDSPHNLAQATMQAAY